MKVKPKRLILGLVTALMVTVAPTSVAFANTVHRNFRFQWFHRDRDRLLVGLGDSITFGYNLGVNNNHPSKYAFPYIIGQSNDMRVRDLGVPGWTSTDLLNALQTSKAYQEAVRHANVVTIDIGSNDLLKLAIADGLLSNPSNPSITPTQMTQFEQAFTQFAINLNQIILDVKSDAPKAQIILYNLYNPIPMNTPLHTVAGELIGQENASIMADAVNYHLLLADANAAFEGKQSIFIRPGDVHPTILGQLVLAGLAEELLVAKGS